jgi:hypothetical protein
VEVAVAVAVAVATTFSDSITRTKSRSCTQPCHSSACALREFPAHLGECVLFFSFFRFHQQ